MLNIKNMNYYKLHRKVDTTGISGTGDVAFAVEFPGKYCVVIFNTEVQSLCVYKSIDDAIIVHCHGSNSEFIPFNPNDASFNLIKNVLFSGYDMLEFMIEFLQ